ncbi:hypothetical protein BJ973_002404 [Actinoplanes tereljensis]|uniref:HEAT repeat domain-containing protein n=1 Tax=Paractinoplanes tereljensis TaxID=571912 RepID=A0A919NR46_9ACTN|nr:hypothetical protein [Actinoplanes tereljensis]GIF22077.1 hypothetical protein Ate02nite_48070 [Actinoplanes tereljensis]
MGGTAVGMALRRWLLGLSADKHDQPERDYLSGPPSLAWVRADVGPGVAAEALLVVARDGDSGLRLAAVEALGSAPARWWPVLDSALRQRWWSAPSWSRRLAAELAGAEIDLLSLIVAGCHRDGRIREAAVVQPTR